MKALFGLHNELAVHNKLNYKAFIARCLKASGDKRFFVVAFCNILEYYPIRGPPVWVCNFLISNQKTGGFYNEKI